MTIWELQLGGPGPCDVIRPLGSSSVLLPAGEDQALQVLRARALPVQSVGAGSTGSLSAGRRKHRQGEEGGGVPVTL